MKLSKFFSLDEFVKSQTALRKGIDNTPPDAAIESMRLLCTNVLDKARERFGPIQVTSGYRSEKLNKAIGGAKTSQHMSGEAADIEATRVDNLVLATWIRDNCDFDQLILEFYNPKEGPRSGWVHVSYKESGNRKEVLTAAITSKGKTTYRPGLG